MKEKKKSDLAVLLGYAGSYKGLTFLGLGLSAVAMVLGMFPYICIWLVARASCAAQGSPCESKEILNNFACRKYRSGEITVPRRSDTAAYVKTPHGGLSWF